MDVRRAGRDGWVDDTPPTPDPAVVVELEARHGQALLGFVRRLGLTDEQAQDCIQDTLLRLWAELRRGTRVDDPRAWAYRTAYRRAMDEHRVRRRVVAVMGRIAELAGARTDAPDRTDRIAVWREVDRLTARQRQVVYLRYRADLPFDDAEAMTVIGSWEVLRNGVPAWPYGLGVAADGRTWAVQSELDVVDILELPGLAADATPT